MEFLGFLIIIFMIVAAYFFFIHPYVEDARRLREYEQSGLNDYPANGYDFEHWVAAKLRNYGWKATVTSSAGDQGIDVIAEKSNVVLGIQCKRLSKPCSNKAVQEAIAGGSFYGIPNVAVVSTSGYTKSAIDLANRVNCFLFTNFDLPKIGEIFGISNQLNNKDFVSKTIIVRLESSAECILGKCFTLVANKNLPKMEAVLPGLAKKVIEGIDPKSGKGQLTVSGLEFKALLDYSAVWLTANVELSPVGTNFDAQPVDLGDGKQQYDAKVSLDTDHISMISYDKPVPFYTLFSAEDIRTLQELMRRLYKQHELPSSSDSKGFSKL